MKLTTASGYIFNIKKPHQYTIKWDGKSRSKFQFEVKQFLKKYWKDHLVFEEFPIPKTRLSLDFFNFTKNIAIEVQGEQHLSYNKFFHGQTNYKYLQQLKRDQYKFDFCKDCDILLVEIYPKDLLSEDYFKSHGVIL